MVFSPFVHACSSPIFHFFAVLFTVIIDVIQRQKKRFSFTTTNAFIAAICHHSLILKAIVIVKGMFSASIRMISVPSSGTIRIFLTPILFAIFAQMFLGSFLPLPIILLSAVSAFSALECLSRFHLAAINAMSCHNRSVVDYDNHVKEKAQRSSRKGVGPSGPKRLGSRTDYDMICTVWEHAAAL